MILLARDVTDPAQLAKPLLRAKGFVKNSDGSTSIQMEDGTYAYQEPLQYGVFHTSPDAIGAYQSCDVEGQLVSFYTRAGDPPYCYTWKSFPNS